MNAAQIIGNLARDPERKETKNLVPIALFTVAVNRRKTQANQDPGADFVQVRCFGNRAESCLKYIKKGSKVGVTGSINTFTYDAPDGTKRYVTEILADEIQFLPSGSGNGGSTYQAADTQKSDSVTGFVQVDDEELPF